MGGASLLVGFYIGMSVLAIFATTVPPPVFNSALLAILGAGFVGLLDDLFAIRRRYKAILPFIASLPLGLVEFSSHATSILGLDVGAFTILLIPLGITSAANASNMLEGFNGLGAGLGIIMCIGLIALSFMLGAQGGQFVLVPLLGALLAFLWYNRYPARIFPGDSLTLCVGAAIACAAIISTPSFKMFGFFLFTPMIVEFVLKARGRFRAENYSTLLPDGRLLYQGRIESLTHFITRTGHYREWQVVSILWGAESLLVAVLLVAARLLATG